MSFRLAHLTDPHLPLPLVRARQLLSKRILGWQSWHRGRKRRHLATVLEAVVRDIAAHRPDRIAITGDISNIALPSEMAAGAVWFREVGPPEQVMVVPGNHDAYVPSKEGGVVASWRPYLAGDDGGIAPAIRRIGSDIAMIGIDTGHPMPWWSSQGRAGADQLSQLEAALAALGAEGRCRVVLIHHPPLAIPGGRGRKGLIDAAGFRDVVARAGAELVIHGHTHRRHLGRVTSSAGETAVIGAPSASAADAGHGDRGGWNLYAIAREEGRWRIDVTCREIDAAGSASSISDFSLQI